MTHVYVVKGLQLGWDNVVGIFSMDVDTEKLNAQFPYPEYNVGVHAVESNLDEYE